MSTRPYSQEFTDMEKKLFLAEIAKNQSIHKACSLIGITYAQYKYAYDHNPQFKEAVDIAHSLFKERVVSTLVERALDGIKVAKWYDPKLGEVIHVKEVDNKLLLELVRVVDTRFTPKHQDGTQDKIDALRQLSEADRRRLLEQSSQIEVELHDVDSDHPTTQP